MSPVEPSIWFRIVMPDDVAAMAACRLTDPAAGPADPRMLAYFEHRHHPQRALPPRTGFLAMSGTQVIGYVAGHMTTRHDCAGEVQYLFVSPPFRRQGIATLLLRLMSDWFHAHALARVCVCVDAESPAAVPFYEKMGAVPLFPPKKGWFVWERMDLFKDGVMPAIRP